MTIQNVANLLRSIGLLVLNLPLPDGDFGLPILLVGEEDWSCSVIVEDNETIVIFEGPNIGRRFLVKSIAQSGLAHARAIFGRNSLLNTRFKDIRNSDPDLSEVIDYLTDNRVKKSIIVG